MSRAVAWRVRNFRVSEIGPGVLGIGSRIRGDGLSCRRVGRQSATNYRMSNSPLSWPASASGGGHGFHMRGTRCRLGHAAEFSGAAGGIGLPLLSQGRISAYLGDKKGQARRRVDEMATDRPLTTARRRLGRTALVVSEVGFGSWGIGRKIWRDSDDRSILEALARAFELGVDFVDAAPTYGQGHSERLIQEDAKGRADSIYVATKMPPGSMIWPPRPGIPFRKAFLFRRPTRYLRPPLRFYPGTAGARNSCS
jgi:hypothetical protein